MAAIAALKTSILKPSFCRLASTVNSVVIQKYGNPKTAVMVQKTQLKEVSPVDVQIKMVAAPVTGFDMDSIKGKNYLNFAFPAIPGSEGVGIVEKVGDKVKSVKENDTVMLIKPFQGTWTEQAVIPENCVLPVPQGLSAENASVLLNTAGIAYRLLNDFASLQAGDFIIQNAASSPVGLAVAQLAKARGIKTINIVCDYADTKDLEAMGGDIIIRESQVDGSDFKKILSDYPVTKLVINGRGGKSMKELCSRVKNSTVVTYNEASNEPFSLTASCMMNNNLCFKGFNMNSWLMSAPAECVKSMVEELAGCVAANTLKFSVKKVKLDDVTKVMQCKCQSKCTCGKSMIPVLSN